ncbi:hypothetical protein Droror1_Dr00007357 [Drosera rotundifolia]
MLQGFLDEFFVQLEEVEDDEINPNFVESIIDLYFTDGTDKVIKLGEELEKTPLNRELVFRYLYNLKCSSASFGAKRVVQEVNNMRKLFNDNNIDGLRAAYKPMRDEHFSLRSRMIPYGELLNLLRQTPSPPPDDACSSTNDYTESSGSNETV